MIAEKILQDFIPDFGVFGDYVCDYGSYADLGEAKSVCKDGLNFLECDIILELRERRKFFEMDIYKLISMKRVILI